MAPDHVDQSPDTTLLPAPEHDPAVTPTHVQQPTPPPVQPEHPNGQPLHGRPKTPGSSRRGKQYKCGNCGELGHNTKTCPRRGAGQDSVAPVQVIQPALVEDGMFGGVTLSSPVGRTGGASPGPPRIQPLKLDAALEAANRRVLSAESAVAAAASNEEFEEATSALDLAVSHLERIGACAKRCALVAYSLNAPHLDMSPAQPMRDNKRLRLDHDASVHAQMQAAVVGPPEEHQVTPPAEPQQKADEGYVE